MITPYNLFNRRRRRTRAHLTKVGGRKSGPQAPSVGASVVKAYLCPDYR